MVANPSRWMLGLLVAASLIPFYLLTFNGTFRVDDEHILGARAQSLALWGRLEAPQVAGNARVQSLQPMGDQATQIEPLQSILGAVLYRLGMLVGMGGEQAMFTLNLYATALTGFVIFLTIDRLGFSRLTAGIGSVLFGLGSMAWPYAETFIRDTLAMLMSSLVLLGWIRLVMPQPGERRTATACILGFGLLGGVLAKNTMVTLAAALVIGGLMGTALARPSDGETRRQLWWVVSAAAVLGLIALVIPGHGWLARFSGTYYWGLIGHFKEQLVQGAWVYALGPFFSPARSVFLFSPPLLLLAGLPWTSRRLPAILVVPMVLFVVGLAMAQALFYGPNWAGTFAWGLRFMLPTLPVLVVLEAPVLQAMLSPRRLWGRIILSGGLLLSGAIQLAGSLVPWAVPFAGWRAQGLDPYTASAPWQARFLVIPAQLAALADPSQWNVAWLRLARAGDPAALAFPGVCLVLFGLLVWRLRVVPRQARWTNLLLTLSLAAPILVPAALLQGDPALGDNTAAFPAFRTWAAETLRPSDGVVVDGYASPLWHDLMNRWDLPSRWFSLSYRDPSSAIVGPRDEADHQIMIQAARQGGAVWLAASLPAVPPGFDWASAAPGLGPPKVVFEGQPAVAVWQMVPSER